MNDMIKVDGVKNDIPDARQFLERIATFMAAIPTMKRGENKNFTCPCCGGEARAWKARLNGHIHAQCYKCGMGVHQ